ncbi:MAG: sulfotransferase domain-containing protein [Candidatus Thiodiazotropha sp. (ex Lucinoma borealis)]|nr:sulfotransferase domain-containing protein [Candidatus Thiodiazotropha sp. (ex Lucinoma borealis)]
MKQKVNLFIVGTVKGGTTWLYDVLSTSNNVFAPDLKEPHYFCENRVSRGYVKGLVDLKEYHQRIKGSEGFKYIVDGSATYMSEPDIPRKIYSYNNNTKIIIMLRHPVRRAFSHYQMDLREGYKLSDFVSTLEKDVNQDGLRNGRMYIGLGLYHDIVNKYFEIFGKDHVHIITYGDLVSDKFKVLKCISDFLSIEPDFSEAAINEKKNVAALPRNQAASFVLSNDYMRDSIRKVVPMNVRSWLKNKVLTKKSDLTLNAEECSEVYFKYFKDDSEKLFKLLNRHMWSDVDDIKTQF